MNAIERVTNAIQGKLIDQVPFAPLASLYGARLISCPLDVYYSNPKKYVEGQQAIVDTISPDIIFTPFALVMEAEAFGSKSVSFEKNPPNLKTPAITSFKDIRKLKIPDINNHPRLTYIRECTRLLVEQYKYEIPIAAIVNPPTELPALIMGIENWIDTLLFHPVEAQLMMKLTSEYFVNFANTLLSEGASCIFAPASFSNPTIITKKIAEDILVPQLRNQFAYIHGPIVFHHGGARLIPFLDMLHDMPNVIGFVIDPRDSFDEARAIIGKDVAIMGNINGPLLLKAPPKTIESWCLKLLENRANDNRYLMTTSNADIPFDTPLENIQIITKTIKRFNR